VLTRIRIAVLSLLLIGAGAARAETPEQWVELLTRVHGGFGSFLAVSICIGEDAMNRLNATPRELSVARVVNTKLTRRSRWRRMPAAACCYFHRIA